MEEGFAFRSSANSVGSSSMEIPALIIAFAAVIAVGVYNEFS